MPAYFAELKCESVCRHHFRALKCESKILPKNFDFPIDIFINIYYNNYSKEKELTTMKFLFIMCSLMVIAGAVSRFGKAVESKRPNYKQMIQYAVELLAVAVVFANF